MSEEHEPTILISNRCEDGPAHVPACKRDKCSVCEKEIWISPSSVEMMQYRKIDRLLCVHCAAEEYQKMSEEDKRDMRVEKPTQRQMDELREAMNYENN